MPTLVGLAIAWGGILLLISPASRLLGDPQRLSANILGQLALWSLFAAILVIVIKWERRPLGSMWLQPFHWSSIGWGVIYTLFALLVVMPAREWVRRAVGLPGFASGMEKILALPIWFRIFAALTAGVVEDLLFFGFTLTRLATVTGSLVVAAAITVVASAAVHIPNWGVGPSISFVAGGIPAAAFFIWRKDLLAMIVAHACIDLWALAVTPLFSAWWLDVRWS
jgi:CAAX protease family protein